MEQAAVYGMAALVVIAPQLLGGRPQWAVATIAAGSLVVLGLAWHATRRVEEASRADALVWVMVAAEVWTVLQALPLPCGLVGWLDPASAAHVARNRALLHDPSLGVCALSRDVGATAWMVLEGVSILAAFWAARALAAAGHRRALLQWIALSPVVMALVALAHLATQAHSVFGLYTPEFKVERVLLAPLLNPNHLAGFLAMGIPLLAALGLREREVPVRALWLTGALLCGACAILTLSRGGMAAVVTGPALLGALWIARSRRQRARWRQAVWIFGLLSLTVGVALYMGLGAISHELASGDVSKLRLIAHATKVIGEHPLLGVGRGGFSAAFAADAMVGPRSRATHPEDLPVQWASEWGLPMALALITIITMSLWRVLRARPSRERLGGLVALVTLALQNLVDFNLELAGVAVVAAALLGATVAPRPRRQTSTASRRWRGRLVPWLPRALLGAGAASLLIVPLVASGSVLGLQRRLEAALDAGNRAEFRKELHHALALHPSEPAFPLLAATEAVRHDDTSAPAWLNRAMELAPTWASPHVVASTWLFRIGAVKQGLLELREASSRVPEQAQPYLCRALRTRADASEIIGLSRGAEDPGDFLEQASECFSPASPVAQALDAELLKKEPGALEPLLRQAARAMKAGDASGAQAQLSRVLRNHPDSADAWKALVEAYLAAGDASKAKAALERARDHLSNPDALLRLEARTEALAGDDEAMRRTITRMRGLAAGNGRAIADALVFQAHLEQQMGNGAQALEALERAQRVAPSDSRLEQVAIMAQQLGNRVQAFRAYTELCARRPDVARYCAAKKHLRAALGEPEALGE